MTGVIESLMMFARADSGAEALNVAVTDLTGVVTEACRRSEPLAEAKQIRLERLIPDGPIHVYADSSALQPLFLILVDNAVKYTPSEGCVRVQVEPVDDHVAVRVEDTGIGISERDRAFIFDRFYRADKARSREAGGAGLGLSIAKWIADAHRASIRVDSAPGQGSTFTFQIGRQRATSLREGTTVAVEESEAARPDGRTARPARPMTA